MATLATSYKNNSHHSRFNKKPVALALLSLAGWLALTAHAQESDGLQLVAGQSFQHDSNVFRLPEAADNQALLGEPSRSDDISVTTLGARFNKPYGLQRVELDVNAKAYRYRRFSQLDFDALNYAAAWRWSFTPALRGNLTSDRQENVDNTADVQIAGEVNRRTERATVLDAEYEVGAAWRVLGGVFERSTANSAPSSLLADTKVRGGEVGARHVFATGNAVAYRYRRGNGEYPGGQPLSALTGDFSDHEHEVQVDWAVTGKTTLQGRVGHLSREHDTLPALDFSGGTARLTANWEITPKTSVSVGAVQNLGSYQAANATYYQDRRVFVAPQWKPTEKTAVRVRYEHGTRDYKGSVPGVTPLAREDRLDLATLSVEWQALRVLKLVASVQRDQRKSNVAGGDYKSNLVGVSALAVF